LVQNLRLVSFLVSSTYLHGQSWFRKRTFMRRVGAEHMMGHLLKGIQMQDQFICNSCHKICFDCKSKAINRTNKVHYNSILSALSFHLNTKKGMYTIQYMHMLLFFILYKSNNKPSHFIIHVIYYMSMIYNTYNQWSSYNIGTNIKNI
jgi:hypothetical protein